MKKNNFSLSKFQNKLGVQDDGQFGPQTARAIMWYFQLSINEACHFLGQFYVETAGFTKFEEGLNYTTAERIYKVFPRYFANVQECTPYVRNAQKLGNHVYANRMGNGTSETGMGYRFKGRGKPHLTGFHNYKLFSEWMHEPRILSNPELVACEFAADAGLFYFETNKIFHYTKDHSVATITKVSKHVNVGNPNSSVTPNHLKERIEATNMIYGWLTRT